MDSEWKQMLDTCKRLGIPFSIHWMPATGGMDSDARRTTFQKILKDAGFNCTALSTNAIIIGDVYHVFTSGQPHWTTYQGDEKDMSGHKGWGEEGMFVFNWNVKTGEHEVRTLLSNNGGEVLASGLAALQQTHGPIPLFTARP